ncbi:MAG: DUF2177 family protein [Rhodospirillales bacterium]|nr:DUF2177 family protein [Rhodospirillales bacterium]
MLKFAIAYAAAAAVFLVADGFWLGLVAKSFYRNAIGPMMAEQVNVAAAAVFYLLYIVGVVVFAVSPAFETGSWRTALVFGALFGLFAYATYDLTNLATLRDWPLRFAVVDLAWGTFVTALAAVAGYSAACLFHPL